MPGDASILFHVSDTHFGVEDRAAMAWFEAGVHAEQPDAIVCTGDLTQRATHRQYADAADWFAGLGVPIMLQPGNHDMPYYNLWERFRRPYARFGVLEVAVGAEIALEHALIVPFDTNVPAQLRWPWSDGVVTRRNLDAALARLEALRADPRPKLVACHHPLLAEQDGHKNPTIRGDQAFAELAAAGASAVLSGHVHFPFDQVRSRDNRAMRMVGAGTLSTRLRKGAPPSYNVIRIDRGGLIEVEHRNFRREN
ncbi:metallophosphoesterase [Altererythrobacter sp. BO-6]|uniref:metallophosphoesterase family protein n=1 Tax=Altererythrobacter sp. BO-6 TaxID=2604537 RepID=UPI0013E10923|nr:metallophosphoesterase [Altererythrobacter sp. BO-6]QIG54190.1 metallophosphoesterase [Altererythrobacter sp. BO-6]